MIDDKTLAEYEAELTRLQHHYRAHPDMTGNFAKHAEIIRFARRYLALRKNIAEFRHFDLLLDEEDESSIDAAADRLLEGGK